jgi:hypothetical protein
VRRAPELGDGCRPGGSCPDCNDDRPTCWECDATVEHEDVTLARIGGKARTLCPDCAEAEEYESAGECEWCGRVSDIRFCSPGCRRAAESDHA